MLTVGLIGNPTIGAQQGYYASKNLLDTAPQTFERYAGDQKTHFFYEYREISGDKFAAASATTVENGQVSHTSAFANAELLDNQTKQDLAEHAAVDVPAVKESYLFGSREAIRLTAFIPGMMAIGYLMLLIYYKSIGGYKVLDPEGEILEPPSTSL